MGGTGEERRWKRGRETEADLEIDKVRHSEREKQDRGREVDSRKEEEGEKEREREREMDRQTQSQRDTEKLGRWETQRGRTEHRVLSALVVKPRVQKPKRKHDWVLVGQLSSLCVGERGPGPRCLH